MAIFGDVLVFGCSPQFGLEHTWKHMLAYAQKSESENLLRLALAEAEREHGKDSPQSELCVAILNTHLRKAQSS